MKWLHSNRSLGITTETMDLAAQYGYLEVVNWLHGNSARCTAKAMDCAAGNGHLDVVKWLHENQMEGRNTDTIWILRVVVGS
ncbi:hypothetical protein JG687_00012474 [Phytophthora cactorum]|uniref:Ankyrin repeat-containing domain n=1 Tax=Phytophthora cactorum TaxID=29920 RepID=A0A8T1U4A9_9STRA|nr:hypothetical protein JG687_00012474 [Phytophthora cactorum]